MTTWLASCSPACGDDDSQEPLACIEIDPKCEEGFPPTWKNVHKFVIEQSCSVGTGGGCHGSDARKGNLDMSSPQDAYEGLVGGEGGQPRVTPKDPACSVLMERLNSADPDVRMPLRSRQLSAADRCAVQQWIALGAPE